MTNCQYVTVAKIGAPHGLQGDLKLHIFCQSPDDIVRFKQIYVACENQWQLLLGYRVKAQSGHYLIQFDHCHDRDQARQYVNLELAIDRVELPELAENEYYQADLIGLAVSNQQGEYFGRVDSILETGANDVLVIQGEQEYLIPYLDHVVLEIELAQQKIIVDWQKDYL